ncbi:MAG TPA: twin-arginine translocase subunit TatC, partial [Dehalococcoidia bacterium]|nr:twin-arginine translocase subunit TatC [Dehalococcoidia bacterium]
LLIALVDTHPRKRLRAALALVELRPPHSLEPLQRLLLDTSHSVSEAAAAALQNWYLPDLPLGEARIQARDLIASALVDGLRTDQGTVSEGARDPNGFWTLNPDELVEAIGLTTRDVRSELASAPAAWVAHEFLPALERKGIDPIPLIPESIVIRSQPLALSAITRLLAETLQSEYPPPAEDLIEVVGILGDARVIPALFTFVKERPDGATADATAVALALIRPTGWPALRNALGHNDAAVSVRRSAALALSYGGDVSFNTLVKLTALLESPLYELRTAAAAGFRACADLVPWFLATIPPNSPEARMFFGNLLELMEGKPVDLSAPIPEKPISRDNAGIDVVNYSQHINELKKRFTLVFFVAVGAALFSVVFAEPLIFLIAEWLYRVPADALVRSLPLNLEARVTIGVAAAAWVGWPVLVVHVWRFIAPGLIPNERRPAGVTTVLLLSLFLIAPSIVALVARGLWAALPLLHVPAEPSIVVEWTNRLSPMLAILFFWAAAFRPIAHFISVQLRAANVYKLTVGAQQRAWTVYDLLSPSFHWFVIASLGASFLLTPDLLVSLGVAALGIAVGTSFAWSAFLLASSSSSRRAAVLGFLFLFGRPPVEATVAFLVLILAFPLVHSSFSLASCLALFHYSPKYLTSCYSVLTSSAGAFVLLGWLTLALDSLVYASVIGVVILKRILTFNRPSQQLKLISLVLPTSLLGSGFIAAWYARLLSDTRWGNQLAESDFIWLTLHLGLGSALLAVVLFVALFYFRGRGLRPHAALLGVWLLMAALPLPIVFAMVLFVQIGVLLFLPTALATLVRFGPRETLKALEGFLEDAQHTVGEVFPTLKL